MQRASRSRAEMCEEERGGKRKKIERAHEWVEEWLRTKRSVSAVEAGKGRRGERQSAIRTWAGAQVSQTGASMKTKAHTHAHTRLASLLARATHTHRHTHRGKDSHRHIHTHTTCLYLDSPFNKG